MGGFKVGDWEEGNSSNKAWTTFTKSEKIHKKTKRKNNRPNKADRDATNAVKAFSKKGIKKAKTFITEKKKLKGKLKDIKNKPEANTPSEKTDKPKIKTLKVNGPGPNNAKTVTNKKPARDSNKKRKLKLLKSKQPNVEDIDQITNRKVYNNPVEISRKDRKNNSLTLRERMLNKLNAARFRCLNEEIYVKDGKHAEKMFKSDPDSFKTYHAGYKTQVEKWPMNPLDVMIESIKLMAKTFIIADFGCGEARLSKSVSQTVHSFDLVAVDPSVTVANMASVPLPSNSVDVAVFCLSLMGVNLHDYIREANRVLKVGGIMKIAEVESRFDGIDPFIKGVEQFGFKKFKVNFSHNLFYFIDFRKESKCKALGKLPTLTLKPCLYKKR